MSLSRGFALCFTLWIFTVRRGSTVRAAGGGQPRVIGPLKPVVAVVGNDIMLPCHLEPSSNMERFTVEWSRPDVKPDPSDLMRGVEYVYLYRGRREVKDMKMQSYDGRTDLPADNLRRGNISLKILNVTLEDGGRYRCFVPQLKSDVKASIVELIVEPVSVPTWTPTPTTDPGILQTEEPETDAEGVRSHLVALGPAIMLVIVLLVLCAAFKFDGSNQQSIRPQPKKIWINRSKILRLPSHPELSHVAGSSLQDLTLMENSDLESKTFYKN